LIGHINFDVKTTGERNAGNPHVAFDVAGAGNGAARLPRQSSTLLGKREARRATNPQRKRAFRCRTIR
jgi:hypothetical protein